MDVKNRVETCLETAGRELESAADDLHRWASELGALLLKTTLTTEAKNTITRICSGLEQKSERAAETETEIRWLLGS